MLINESESKQTIKSYNDLNVYKSSYNSMLIIHKQIIPKLPKEEHYILRDQLLRSSKAVPRLIAEGHSKRHQKKGFQKYIDDAMAEANETTVSISQAKDIYSTYVDSRLCAKLIDEYTIISKQLYKLALAWDKFENQRKKYIPNDQFPLTNPAAKPISNSL